LGQKQTALSSGRGKVGEGAFKTTKPTAAKREKKKRNQSGNKAKRKGSRETTKSR